MRDAKRALSMQKNCATDNKYRQCEMQNEHCQCKKAALQITNKDNARCKKSLKCEDI